MSTRDYGTFFSAAMGSTCRPYSYQSRLAELPCESRLISIPTGLGKTAAVFLAWLWNRQHREPLTEASPRWPRRLVYCLPMRTLVEQTSTQVDEWIGNLVRSGFIAGNSPKVHILMGGEDTEPWDIYPERDAILIGTQDMLLSRALNRGYGMSRYRWPMHFGLLNQDCLWVLDETQLMGVALETSAQLNGFRSRPEWLSLGACATWWMSATLESHRLETIDNPIPPGGWPKIALSQQERASAEVKERIEGRKAVRAATVSYSSAEKKEYARQTAALVADKHVPGTLSLVVVNRVTRAQEIYAALQDPRLKLKTNGLAIIHSRFRPDDREKHMSVLLGGGDRIVVATQAVEAGVDVSARLLVTELAPWSSLVQRFGRCNRYGKDPDAEVIWVDIKARDEKDDACLPYNLEELEKARTALEGIQDAGPSSLESVSVLRAEGIRPVLRRRDLIDLFDTTPDLCGQDLDISRYLRDGQDTDVQLLWRHETDGPQDRDRQVEPRELCRVSIADAAKFFKRETTRAWQWNPLGAIWERTSRVRAGAVYRIDAGSGGYSESAGWTGNPKDIPTVPTSPSHILEAYDRDTDSFLRVWQTLKEHTGFVTQAASSLCSELGLNSGIASPLLRAAEWHDVGKAHPQFQEMLCAGAPDRAGRLWAKSGNTGGRCDRPGFRHELASALAWLQVAPPDEPERDLVAYLIAAHHGKVRLSIRALPDEPAPPGAPGRLFARGIWDGDTLSPGALDEIFTAPVTLDLSVMQMGTGPRGPSWLSRMIALRERLGPFALGYLEALLRAADARGSQV